MSSFVLVVLALLAGYLVGAIPFGYLVARSRGVDILKEGSGNPGATNVKRVVGKTAGNVVFALDFLKGCFAAGWPLLLQQEASLAAAVAGLCAAIGGHSFSIFLKGRGGKGVATTMGGLLVVLPISVLIGVVVWLIVFFASRYVSLASILFAVSLPISSWLLGREPLLIYVTVALALLITIRHRTNIQRLLNGTENRFVREKSNG
ncbi:MAG TPA: glycerol-3-phosphate 1-O-acyltransferase PlsY [Opitutales bacterium]|nr:glycerol-3-phosphate 1-O-acyltransferase PlsY [Opitutales bacterium]